MSNDQHGSSSDLKTKLVEGIRNGDPRAENELVERYWKSLTYIVNRRTNNPDLTHDITQDTFVIVINKVRNGEIENPEAIGAFIRNTGINLVIAHYRKETRRKTETDENIARQFPDKSPSIQQAFGQQELLKMVTQVMDEMTVQRDKDLLYRYFVYGQSKQQICDEFDLTLAHFDRVLHRARSRLKQLLLFKTDAGSDKAVISSLLSVTLLLIINGLADHRNLVGHQVRESVGTFHLIDIAVKDRPSNQLDIVRYQRETR